MQPSLHFQHCPRCGAQPIAARAMTRFDCDACGFVYFFNPTVAVATFVFREDGRVLVIRRAKEPGKGRLAPPGGFVDIGETAEDAAIRETREEVGLEVSDLRFVSSQPNSYLYRDVTYPVLDLFFAAKAAGAALRPDRDEVTDVVWANPQEVAPADLAFPSMQRAWEMLLAERNAAALLAQRGQDPSHLIEGP